MTLRHRPVGEVNDLVHQQLRHRLTPYREPVWVRASRHPGWRWLGIVAGVVLWWGILYLIFSGGWR